MKEGGFQKRSFPEMCRRDTSWRAGAGSALLHTATHIRKQMNKEDFIPICLLRACHESSFMVPLFFPEQAAALLFPDRRKG